MTASHTGTNRFRVVSVGHAAIAVIMIGLGVLGFVTAGFPATWGRVPERFPARVVLAYLCALVALGSGIGLLWQRTAVRACRVLLIYLLAWMVLFRVPYIVTAPLDADAWWAAGDTAVMIAAIWALYACLATGAWFNIATGDKGLYLARLCYGFAMIPFGIAHFTYFAHTVELVPTWLPWPAGWATITGAAFIVAGIVILLGKFVRLAATLSALQLVVFTVLVWVPVVVAGPDAGQWSEFVESCTLSAAAWLFARSYRVPAKLS